MIGLCDSRRWQLLRADPVAENTLIATLGITPLVARVLVGRGITDPAEAHRFLTPSLERDWVDPKVIPGLQKATERLESAIHKHEVISIFGDFDVDGMSAAALLTIGLRALGGDAHPFIPDRFKDGYGLSKSALDRVIADCNPSLVVTVDNGITSGKEVEWLSARGIDTIVTDHHEPADLVPQGIPVCDPKLDPSCPLRELSGAGVALKIVCELGGRFGRPDLWRSLIDLACLGTISDMMLLTGENRALVACGINRMRDDTRCGVRALAATSGIDLSMITADMLPFSLVPRLNAAGRMGSVDVAFRLLLTDDAAEASVLAAQLERINNERREIETSLAEEAIAAAERVWDGSRVVVVAGHGWHEGVKGIVASRLVRHFHVPSVVFSIIDGQARGSGRTVGSVDLFHAVEQCEDLIIRFGGHASAVGVTLSPDNIDAFRKRLASVLAKLPDEEFESCEEVTAEVELKELSVSAIESLEVLQPFGQGNKKPVFAARGVIMRRRNRVGALANHLRFLACDGFSQVAAIMFRVPDVERAAATDGVVDLVFEAVNETWQGRTKVKLMVKDIIYRDADATAKAFDWSDDVIADQTTITATPLISGRVAGDGAAGGGAGDSSESYKDTTAALVRGLIGDKPLLPAQAAALTSLARGHPTMCVMATGRGKSLIFHVHAARESIMHDRASVFVYPLRALVADQSHHLADTLARYGVGVCVLTGATLEPERRQAWDALRSGATDIVLTTPEFLAIHAKRFAEIRRVGFVVIDEAHHVAQASSTRPAYAELPRVLEMLGQPVPLALTATADARTTRQIMALLGIEQNNVILDMTARDNLRIADCRDMYDRDNALVSLVARGDKTIVYVNSRHETVSLVHLLRHAIGDLADRIAYYNAGLTRERRMLVERLFRDGTLRCIVSTSAFGEGVNIADVRNVVLYHLPFGRSEFNQTSGRAGRDGKPARVWLFFGEDDARINERLLAMASPSRDELIVLWRTLRMLARNREVTDGIALGPAEVAEVLRRTNARCILDAHGVSSGIAVFSELGFLKVTGIEGSRRIQLTTAPVPTSLHMSVRYAEGIHAQEEFASFRDWVLSSDSDELLCGIKRPIVPDFGTIVDGGG